LGSEIAGGAAPNFGAGGTTMFEVEADIFGSVGFSGGAGRITDAEVLLVW